MPEPVAAIIVAVVTVYAAAGLVFALAFVVRGVNVIDDRAAGSGWGFRALIAPGSVVLWPVLLSRWARSARRDT